jgi:hypothetical protein
LHCHYMAARNYSDSPIGAPKFVEYMQKEWDREVEDFGIEYIYDKKAWEIVQSNDFMLFWESGKKDFLDIVNKYIK